MLILALTKATSLEGSSCSHVCWVQPMLDGDGGRRRVVRSQAGCRAEPNCTHTQPCRAFHGLRGYATVHHPSFWQVST